MFNYRKNQLGLSIFLGFKTNRYYSQEINNMNHKIMEFGELMERLMAENQRMKIKIEESERKESYFKRQMNEFSKVIIC